MLRYSGGQKEAERAGGLVPAIWRYLSGSILEPASEMPMNRSAQLHDEAMKILDEGDLLRQRGDHVGAVRAFAQALEAEREAAHLEETEPSRGILFRSAAWSALEADQPREAERLAAEGLLSLAVSDRVARELRAVIEVAWVRLKQGVAA